MLRNNFTSSSKNKHLMIKKEAQLSKIALMKDDGDTIKWH